MKVNKSFIRIILPLFFTVINLMAVKNTTAQQTLGDKLKTMTPQQRADYQTGLMKEKLKLDTQQIIKVKVVNLKYALKFEPVMKSDDGRFTKLKEYKALQDNKDAELKTIFKPMQFKMYQDYESEMLKKMRK